jgi:hypothetical protein
MNLTSFGTPKELRAQPGIIKQFLTPCPKTDLPSPRLGRVSFMPLNFLVLVARLDG